MGARGPRQYAAVAAGAGAAAAVVERKRIGLGPAAGTACAYAVPLSIAVGFPRWRVRDGAVWAAQMWAYKNAFEMPADDEERLRRRAHFDYPIVVDRVIGAGAAGRLAATFDLTLLGYWTVPTAPPWWVSEKLGRMDGEVRRVMSEVADWVKGDPNPTEGDYEMGANPFAAMPSDHFASAAMTAILLTEQDRRLGAFGWAYALGLGFALVYLGEHSVGDLLAGLALALSVNAARGPLKRGAEGVLGLGPRR